MPRELALARVLTAHYPAVAPDSALTVARHWRRLGTHLLSLNIAFILTVTIVVVVVVVGAWVGRGGGLKQASDKDKQIPGQMGESFFDS